MQRVFANVCIELLLKDPFPGGEAMRQESRVCYPMVRASVVLVDDHPAFRKGLRAIIDQDERFHVVAEAQCGYEAIQAVDQHRAALVLLDYQLPGLTGLVIAPILHRRSPQSRIVFLSAYDAPENIRDAMEAGAAAYVTKSQGPEDLLDIMSSVASGETPIVDDVALQSQRAEQLSSAPGMPRTRLVASDDEGDIEPEPLSPREITVLDCVVQGQAYRTCAENLFISEATVKNNVANILSKWGLNSRIHLLLHAIRIGWIQLSATRTEPPRQSHLKRTRKAA
jgi:DNA-binding NarL/FixJ family response regulator